MASAPEIFLERPPTPIQESAPTSAVFFLSMIANLVFVLFSIWGVVRFGQYTFDMDNQFTFTSKDGKTCWRDGEGAWLAGHDHEWIKFASTASMISAIINMVIMLVLISPSKLEGLQKRFGSWAIFTVGLTFVIPAILNLVFLSDTSKYSFFNVDEENHYTECDDCETNPAYCFMPLTKFQNSLFSGILILWLLSLIGQLIILYLSTIY